MRTLTAQDAERSITLYGGRGVYFYDPNDHLFELITRPYGATPEKWSEVADRERLKSV
jgi:hypothetical protein